MVSGPYQPVSINKYGYINEYGHTCREKTATLATVFEMLLVYKSIMMWRGHEKCMASSMRHAAVMMGEIDEPSEHTETYNPMSAAGFFAINFTLEIINLGDHKKNKTLPRTTKQFAMAVIGQLLFAIANDDDALAQYARYMRTGFIGNPTQSDIENIDQCRQFLRKLIKMIPVIEEYFISNTYDIPLQKPNFGYDAKSGLHYWSPPITLPQINRIHNDE